MMRLLQAIALILTSYASLLALLQPPSAGAAVQHLATRATLLALQDWLNVTRRSLRTFWFLRAFDSSYARFRQAGPLLGAEALLDVVAGSLLGVFGLLETATLPDMLGIPGLAVFGPDAARRLNEQAQLCWLLALLAAVLAAGVRVCQLWAERAVPAAADFGEGKEEEEEEEEDEKGGRDDLVKKKKKKKKRGVQEKRRRDKEEAARKTKAEIAALTRAVPAAADFGEGKEEEEEEEEDEKGGRDDLVKKKKKKKKRGVQEKRRRDKEEAARKTKAEIAALTVKMVNDTLDMVIPANFCGWSNFHPGQVGVAMAVTSWITLRDHWERCGRAVQ
ncbi:hypothetical protein BBAD15_g4940 [Beauveria bassiana D1-5]|uniref:AoPex11B-like protein n=1 Tax=Beauveria bassiana D1-5 TaxID=1245745 RepID=A0A0A2VU94_BEABA|nr:hypothetical protein BBAD15_g4940 [Beauveria bassiana D1-5]